MDTPLMCVMRSPVLNPARSAGLPGATIPISGATEDSHRGVGSVPMRSHPHSLHRREKPNHPSGDAGLGGTGGSPTPGGIVEAGGIEGVGAARGARGVVGISGNPAIGGVGALALGAGVAGIGGLGVLGAPGRRVHGYS